MSLCAEPMRVARTSESLIVHLDQATRLDFALRAGMVEGLSQARIEGLSLVAEGSLRLPYIETRDNWALWGYRLVEAVERDGGVVIEADVLAAKPGLGRKTDGFQVPYVTTPCRTPRKIGRLRWRLIPETITIGHPGVRTNSYSGFSYTYEFDLDHPFHWILDSGTWEVGGAPAGITLLSPHMAPIGGPMEYTIPECGGSYTSGETFVKGSSNHADVIPDIPNDPSFGYVIPIQAQLRGAGGALVDVQFNDAGILICYYKEPDYYRTLVEWRDGEVGIGHLDHHFFPLTTRYTSPPKTILAARLPDGNRIDALNRWTDVWDYVAASWRERTGIPRTEPVPGFGLDNCGGAGVDFGSGPPDLFERWEARFDWMREFGFKTFFISSFLNHRGLELPMVANMCQPYDYTCQDAFGGSKRFKLFCERAHAHGIEIYTWVGVFLSTFAPILLEHPEWTIRYDNGSIWDGNYQILQACSLRKGFGDWLLAQIKGLKELGLDGIFIDSYHNLSAMPVDYGDSDLVPQFRDLMAFQAQCHQMGVATMVETVSPLGITSCGLWPQYLQPAALSYRTHLRSTVDDRAHNDLKNGTLDVPTYFRMLAHKAPIGFAVTEQANAVFEGLPEIPNEIGAMNRLYARLSPLMQVRTLHQDGSVEWRNPDTGAGALFALDGSVTVPMGCSARGVYGTDRVYPAGTHRVEMIAAFELVAATKAASF